ncbi:hypothetical protein HK099_004640 [Clydaea vesicula]|uniref:Uncharacterized protein n=1 Tax=Clydaea vesicula TaxID=447962 RepID=A0AAD5U0I6_9FUNG|nr:hypothetical protein HK099_004640 [Clydaea vesicula]
MNSLKRSGKTVVFSNLVKRLPNPKPTASKVLILAHRDELLQQAIAKIKYFNPELIVGLDQGKSKPNLQSIDIVVASLPTLARESKTGSRLSRYDPDLFKCIIIDEAHHAAAAGYLKVLKHFRCEQHYDDNHILLWGCSGTLFRHDGLSLGAAFDKIVFEKGFPKMIEEGWLCDFNLTRIKTKTDLDKIKTSNNGDYQVKELSAVVNTPQRNSLVVNTYRMIKEDPTCLKGKFNKHLPIKKKSSILNSTIVFAVDRQHIDDLQKEFILNGFNAKGLSSYTKDSTRKEILAEFRSGALPIIINCGILTEGVDIPRVDSIFLARPTRSLGLLQQMLGRGLRKFDDDKKEKRFCTIIDFVDVFGVNKRGALACPATLLGMPEEFNEFEEGESNGSIRAHHGGERGPVCVLEDGTNFSFTNFDPDFLTTLHEDDKTMKYFSRFNWIRFGQHDFFLNLPDRKSTIMIIEEENLFKSYLHSKIKIGDKLIQRKKFVASHNILDLTIKGWDTWVMKKYKYASNLCLKNSSWRQEKVSEAQYNFINRRNLFPRIDEKNRIKGDQLSKGLASPMASPSTAKPNSDILIEDYSFIFQGCNALKQQNTYFKKRAEIEKEYATKLTHLHDSLCKEAPSAFFQDQSSYVDFIESSKFIISCHNKLSFIANELHNSITVKKRRYEFFKKHAQYISSENEGPASASKTVKLQQETKTLDIAYRQSLQATEDCRIEYLEFIERATNLLKLFEKDRIAIVRSFDKFLDLETEYSMQREVEFKKLRCQIEMIDVEGDIEKIFKVISEKWPKLTKPVYNHPNYSAPLSSMVFNVPIDFTVKQTGTAIPQILEICVNAIEKRGLEKEGIYRLSGKQKELSDLRQQMEVDCNLPKLLEDDVWDINVIAGLVKWYIRELPEPLFPFSVSDRLDYQKDNATPEEKIHLLRNLYRKINGPKQTVVKFFINHLHKVAQHSDKNKMTAQNLSVLFGPMIFQSSDSLNNLESSINSSLSKSESSGGGFSIFGTKKNSDSFNSSKEFLNNNSNFLLSQQAELYKNDTALEDLINYKDKIFVDLKQPKPQQRIESIQNQHNPDPTIPKISIENLHQLGTPPNQSASPVPPRKESSAIPRRGDSLANSPTPVKESEDLSFRQFNQADVKPREESLSAARNNN